MSPKTLVLSVLCVALMNFSRSVSGVEDPPGYMGCFKDHSARALPLYRGNFYSRSYCISKCQNVKLPYAGIQYGGECRCGYYYKKYGKASGCNMNCRKDRGCGGYWANAVYKVPGIPAEYKDPEGYMGCWKDGSDRALPHYLYDVLLVKECIHHCRRTNHKYAGIQYGKQCWCGYNYKKYGRSNGCNMSCVLAGICGGHWANSVYKVCK